MLQTHHTLHTCTCLMLIERSHMLAYTGAQPSHTYTTHSHTLTNTLANNAHSQSYWHTSTHAHKYIVTQTDNHAISPSNITPAHLHTITQSHHPTVLPTQVSFTPWLAGAHQRYFKQLLNSIKASFAIKEAERALRDNMYFRNRRSCLLHFAHISSARAHFHISRKCGHISRTYRLRAEVSSAYCDSSRSFRERTHISSALAHFSHLLIWLYYVPALFDPAYISTTLTVGCTLAISLLLSISIGANSDLSRRAQVCSDWAHFDGRVESERCSRKGGEKGPRLSRCQG